MWPWLGTVKRDQATAVLETVARQYSDGIHAQRSARQIPTLTAHERAPKSSASRLQFAWAAGFLDAEGYFGNPRGYVRKDGSIALRVRASASQHGMPELPAEVLFRLRELLGGRIERHGEIDDHKWVVEGLARVDWVVEELRPWL